MVNIQDASPEAARQQREFVARFQQVTGPVMAKGVEDTAFYVYNRLISLNDVGGDPERFGMSRTAFHRANANRYAKWPYSLLSTSTHDTKRSEDVRARINVLSEIPGEWRSALARWSRLNSKAKSLIDGRPAPDRNDEYLLYQTLLGASPLKFEGSDLDSFRERILAFMIKAIKEAKVNTSWINPNVEYEGAMEAFVSAILSDGGEGQFLDDYKGLLRKVSYYGMLNSLSQTLLKIAGPGVPDIYQGNEIWDFSLVDPDNRRPIDFACRTSMLDRLRKRLAARNRAELLDEVLQSPEDGRVKMLVTHLALKLRRELPQVFTEGTYTPLTSSGSFSEHVCAFSRSWGGDEVIAVAPVLIAGLLAGRLSPSIGSEVWRDTHLRLTGRSRRSYVNILTNEAVAVETIKGHAAVRLDKVLGLFPVALLRAE